MLIVCGQCRYRFEADAIAPEGLACPRCGRVIARPSAEDDPLAAEAESLPEEIVEAEEEGFAEAARQTAGRKVTVACGACGRSLKVSARLAGKARRCPGCKAKILIPYPEDEEDAAFLKQAGLEEEEGLDLARGPSSRHAPPDGTEGQGSAGGEGIVAGGGESAGARGPAEARRGVGQRYHRPHPRRAGGPDGGERAARAIAAAAAQVQADAAPAVMPPAGATPARGESHGAAAAPVEIESSLAEAAKKASVAPPTVDLDGEKRRRFVKTAAVAIAGLCLAVGVIIVSWFLFIRPSGSPADDASGGGSTGLAAGGSNGDASGGPSGQGTGDSASPATGDSNAESSTALAANTGDDPTSTTRIDRTGRTSIFTVPVLVPGQAAPLATPAPTPPPAPTPSPSPTPAPIEPRCVVAQAVSDLFLADGYCPAAPGQAYLKVEIEVSAGAKAIVVDPFAKQAGLAVAAKTIPCSGLLEKGSWPAQRVVRREVPLAAGQTAKVALLFRVPQAVVEAVLRLEGFADTPVKVAAGPSGPGGTLWAGTYVEAPPRNLQPLLRNPVMASVQSATRLQMTVAKDAGGFRLALPGASITGTATPGGAGTYAVHLQKGAAGLDGKLRAATGGKLLVLYLQDSPFHQITFKRQDAPAR